MKNLNNLEKLMDHYVSKQTREKNLIAEWGRRAVLELMYAVKLSEIQDNGWDNLLEEALSKAWEAYTLDGAITKQTCLQLEQLLSPMAKVAKAYTLICVGHAHIDMNWMWSYDETVSVTLETFRTVLDLMNIYPDFTFAQSQASVYEMAARYDPDMLDEIRERVQEGRWEVTASTWVEADRNMPTAESMARHFLYTRQYLADLLNLDPATLDLDYEPDTFGHHQNVPEVLCDAGVRYYYHCRGAKGPYLYRWRAPSGRNILVYREPLWYNWTMDGRCALLVPELCHKTKMKTSLRVYGVGDHGGGPTRRDIENIIEMDSWPIFPHYRFGTYHDYFHEAEAVSDQLPVVEGELNFIFDGCYSSQSRIKQGNRKAEQALFEGEIENALINLALGRCCSRDAFQEAWKKVMFNQFHDILPGSGKAETRDYAMALYQEAFALINSQRMKTLRALAGRIHTASLSDHEGSYPSIGAGVGYPTGMGNLSRTARHDGMRRIFMVWNPLPYEREQLCELTLWDFPAHIDRLRVCSDAGNVLPHQVIDKGTHSYWGHTYINVLVSVRVPATGYRTLTVDEMPLQTVEVMEEDVRVIIPSSYILENELIRVVVSEKDASILSFYDKESGQEYADPQHPLGIFRLILEDASRGMTAWAVGAYQKILPLHESIRFTNRSFGPLRQSLSWCTTFGNQSSLSVTLSLDVGERMLCMDLDVCWQEIGSQAEGVQQLNFFVPVKPSHSCYRYSIPMGQINRPPLPHDVPALTYALIPKEGSRALQFISDCKYGYRGTPEGLSMTLIRSTVDPDPWPEIGSHHIRLGLALVHDDQTHPDRQALFFNHPLQSLSLPAKQDGDWPLQASLFSFQGEGLVLSGVKMAEDHNDLIIRLYSQSNQPRTACFGFRNKPEQATLVDLMEQPVQNPENLPVIEGMIVRVTVPPYRLITLRLCFGEQGI